MKKNPYFPLEVNIVKNAQIAAIVDKHGAKGIGGCIVLLIELFNHENHRCKLSFMRFITRAYKLNKKLMEDLIHNRDLFELTEEDGETYISSPYLTRVLKKQKNRQKSCSIAGQIGAEKRWRKNSICYQDVIAINNTDDDVILNTKERKRIKPWQEYLAEALNDRTWVECQAMHSGLGDRFVKYEKDIAGMFMNHVIIHGKDSALLSVQDVKYYFANFIRQGTITCKRISKRLHELEQELEKENPYRFETVDPVTGERSYYGNIIPQDAPPRPNERVAWNDYSCCWE